jgi:DNA-binding LacI/PurR family transcriptional regulator
VASKHPTILDVAERAGVSKSLVSLVMRGSTRVSDESRRKVLAAARQLGYRPNVAARVLVRQRSHFLGVMVSDLHNPFFPEVLDGLEEEARDSGYRTLMTTGVRVVKRELDAINTLLELRVDGLVLASPRIPTADLSIAAESVPTVVLGKAARTRLADSVHNDDRVGSRLVVDHLSELGHREIAHISSPRGAGGSARQTGYVRAMEAVGLGEEIAITPGGFTEDAGADAMRRILGQENLPTAVFVANDIAAIGALEVLDSAGVRVPEDVSIVGYDNLALSHNHRIGLTTVDQPRYDMGRVSVSLIVERLERGRTDAKTIVLPPKLIMRDTTAPPRADR